MVFEGDDGDNDNDNSSDETTDDDYDTAEQHYLDYIHESLRKIEANDPTFTMLKFGLPVGNYLLPPDDVWENLGDAIGRGNTQLKEISFDHPTVLLFRRFLPGFVLNRSIQKVRICGNIHDEKQLNQLTTEFFNHNTVKCLEVEHSVRTAKTILQSFDSLEEFS
jgi:hypothetical protein